MGEADPGVCLSSGGHEAEVRASEAEESDGRWGTELLAADPILRLRRVQKQDYTRRRGRLR